MRIQITTLALLLPALFVPAVLGHGQVRSVITSSGTYTAADAYAAADPNSPIRKLNSYGPPADFTGPDITCGPGGNVPVTPLAEVQSGSVVTFDWGQWTSVHPGPVMTYLAKCPNGCANFKGDTGNVWVKIDQDGYNPTRPSDIPWGEEIIRLRGNQYKVTLPAGLENGEYILRHEILGLHVAGNLMGAQFYPNCLQIKVVNGGSVALPQGIPLPGSYDPHDPGVLVELWRISPSSPGYVVPGGPVLLKGGTGDWGQAAYGNGTAPPPPSSSSVSRSSSVPPSSSASRSSSVPPSSSSSRSSSSAGPSASLSVVAKYGQCGGQSYTGPTVCVSGSTCTVVNPYYSQCL